MTYWGRSPNSTPGLDQIVFMVPAGAPLGCNVSVVVQTGAQVSNAPTISVAAVGSATCSDANASFPSSIFGHDGLKTLTLNLGQYLTIKRNADGSSSQTYESGGSVTTYQLTGLSPTSMPQVNDQPSLGTCYGLYGYGGEGDGFPGRYLDAGPSMTLTPSSGSALTLTPQFFNAIGGLYNLAFAQSPLPGGTWTLSNGAGGVDVPPFHFTFTPPQPVVWTNATSVLGHPLDRTQPLVITWSGGDSNNYIKISGFAGNNGYGTAFTCAAPVTGGQFAIPTSMLLALPPGSQGEITVSTVSRPLSLGNAPGFDATLNTSVFTTIATPVIFQ